MEDGSGAVSPAPGPSLTLGREPNEPVTSTAAEKRVIASTIAAWIQDEPSDGQVALAFDVAGSVRSSPAMDIVSPRRLR
jgi:hypothetical protein